MDQSVHVVDRLDSIVVLTRNGGRFMSVLDSGVIRVVAEEAFDGTNPKMLFILFFLMLGSI